MAASELRKRVAVASVGIPFAFLLIYWGGWPLALVLAACAAGVAWELFRLARARGIEPYTWLGTGSAVALVLLAGWLRDFSEFAAWGFGLSLCLMLLAFSVSIWRRGPDRNPLPSASITAAGALYAGGCLAFGLLLRHLPETWGTPDSGAWMQGQAFLAFPLFVTWIGDSAAYFLGKRFGKAKLIPDVSPGKTRVGGVAGLVGAALTGAVMGATVLGVHREAWVGALLGAAMGAVLGVGAQVGDLVESVLKREAGVKDSGAILPGHGGVFDRFDALLVNIPLAYLLLHLVAR